jgi:hypothetical protein
VGAVSIAEPLSISGTGSATNGALRFNAAGTVSGTVALTANSTIQVASSFTGTISGVVSGSANLTKEATGTLLLSGTNTYT